MPLRACEYSMASLHRQSIEVMIRAAYGYIEPETKTKRTDLQPSTMLTDTAPARQLIEAMIRNLKEGER